MICEKVEYLSKFYNQETLLVYKEMNEELFNKLYEETLPQQIRIDDVSDSDCAWFVDSEDGFVEVKSRINKGEQEILLVTFSDNTVIRTSPFHLFESENGSWIATANLTPGTNIKTKTGIASVVSVEDTLKKECVYDLAVKHKSHKYYTDGISSHNSGAGKSVFLQNLAVNWAGMGLNVVYISLELSEKLCAMRLDAMIADYGTNEVMKNIDDVAMRVGAFQKRQKGNICIKQMPNGCTANDVRAYIKEFEIQKGVTVDAILLDYLDLCMPMSVKVSPSDMFVKDKYVSEELRNLAVDLNVLFVTASQLNRCLTLDALVEVKGKGIVEIKDVDVGDQIKTDVGYNTILNKFPVQKQRVYKIKTKSGKTIRCSGEHIFPTPNGNDKIHNTLAVGSKLYTKRE